MRKKAPPPLTDEEKIALVGYFLAGKSMADLALGTGRHHLTIEQMLREAMRGLVQLHRREPSVTVTTIEEPDARTA